MESPGVEVQWLALSVSNIVMTHVYHYNSVYSLEYIALTTPYLFTLCHPIIIGSKDVKRSVDYIII